MKKVICISGASSGIGAASARLLAKDGHHLALGARRTDRLKELSKELFQLGAASVLPVALDVRDQSSVNKFGAAVLEKYGHIDVLFNNAGLVLGLDKLADGNISDWETILDTNLMGVLRLTRYFLPKMIEHGKGGDILMLGSISGFQVYEGGGPYCASKFGLRAISKALKLELNGTGIRVCSIDPGMVETEFSIVRFRGDKDKAASVYKGLKPLSAEDIADCVKFILDRPAHINIDHLVVMPTDQATVYKVKRT